MVCKYVGVDVIAKGAQQQDGEHGYGAGVAFVEGVDVPYAGGEEGNPFKQLLSMQFVVMDVTLELEVAVKRHAQFFPMEIENGILFEYPFLFDNVVGTQLTGVVVNAIEKSAMEG